MMPWHGAQAHLRVIAQQPRHLHLLLPHLLFLLLVLLLLL